jgi:DNA repair exonuclease SbcCD ATPase subunit
VENIVVKYEVDTSGIDAVYERLDQLQNREQELLKSMNDIRNSYNAFTLNYKTAGKTQEQVDADIAKAREKSTESAKMARKELDNVRNSIASLHKRATELESVILKGAARQTTLIKQFRDTKEQLNQMALAGDTSSQAYVDLAVKAEKLKYQLSLTEKTITTMASSTKNMDTVMGVGQGLTGTFTAATSAMALFGGENEELQKAFFKVQAALQVLNGVQMVNSVLVKSSTANIVLRNSLSKLFTRNKVAETTATAAHTVATGAETTATVAATAATKGFTKALLSNPVFWIVAVIMGAVFAISKLVSALNSENEQYKELAKNVELYAEMLKRAHEESTKISNQVLKEGRDRINLIKEQGASEEELLKLEKELNATRVSMADAEVFFNQKENISNLDSYKKRIEALQGALNAINSRGKSVIEMEVDGKLKDVKVDEDSKEQLEQELSGLKVNVEVAEGALEEQRQALQEEAELREKIKKFSLEQSNSSATAAAEYRVLMARKGSEEELRAQTTAIVKQRDIELQNVNLTAAERRKITAKANEDIRKLNEDFNTKKLQDEKTGYETQMALVKEGSQDAFDLQLKALEKQKEIDLNNANLTGNERLKIENEYLKEKEKLTKEFNRKQSEDELNTQIAGINAKLAATKEGSQAALDLNKELLDKQAELERKSIEATITNETLRAEKIAEIDAKLKADRKQADNDYRQNTIEHNLAMSNAEIEAERIKNEKIMASGGFIERLQARENLKNLELQAISVEMQALDEKHKAGIVTEQEYQQQMAEIRNEYAVLEVEQLQEQQEAMKAAQQEAFDFAISLINGAYDSKKAALEQELADLHHYYTTDAEEAKKNANLKLISEEELARRELDIKRRKAQADKEQGIFNAVISTITAVVGTLAQQPIGIWNIALAAIMAAAGAVQIAKISSQPLPKYAKGRKGGKGEMAWIGERGPEIMWIPEGASIVPANLSKTLTPEAMKRYDIPMPRLPEMPRYEVDTTEIRQRQYGLTIDYDKLGRAVAENVHIPDVSQLNVSMDEDGFRKYLIKGNSRTEFLNKRFRW